MDRKIIALGNDGYGINGIKLCKFDSNDSLLDGDIILLYPQLSEFPQPDREKVVPRFVSYSSSRGPLRAKAHTWRQDIRKLLSSGATVITFLPKRDALPSQVSSYDYLPITLNTVPSFGEYIKPHAENQHIVLPYWQKMERYSKFEIIFSGHNPNLSPCFITKRGGETVGAIQTKRSGGALVLLPLLDFERISKEKKGLEFVKAIIALDKALRGEDQEEQIIPEPEWVKASDYKTKKETELEQRLSEHMKTTQSLERELSSHQSIKYLLYANSTPLEEAVRAALFILGFKKVTQYKEGKLEIDVVFESSEGTFVGEVEGREKKAISIDKFRHLRDNVEAYDDMRKSKNLAKGVLFGNACMLTPPEKRKESFTDSCVDRATQRSVALVATADLFSVVQYLSDNDNPDYAKKCREAIREANGIVNFPPVPTG